MFQYVSICFNEFQWVCVTFKEPPTSLEGIGEGSSSSPSTSVRIHEFEHVDRRSGFWSSPATETQQLHEDWLYILILAADFIYTISVINKLVHGTNTHYKYTIIYIYRIDWYELFYIDQSPFVFADDLGQVFRDTHSRINSGYGFRWLQPAGCRVEVQRPANLGILPGLCTLMFALAPGASGTDRSSGSIYPFLEDDLLLPACAYSRPGCITAGEYRIANIILDCSGTCCFFWTLVYFRLY